MKYFQTWAMASRISRRSKWLGAFLRWLCGKLTGHRVSKTEWGYGGGPTANVWCRWCNQPGSMPVSKALDRFENMRNTFWNATGCDLKNQEFAAPSPQSNPQGEKP